VKTPAAVDEVLVFGPAASQRVSPSSDTEAPEPGAEPEVEEDRRAKQEISLSTTSTFQKRSEEEKPPSASEASTPGSSNRTFEVPDNFNLNVAVDEGTFLAGYVQCANCKQSFPNTGKVDGRHEVRVLPCFHSVCGPCLQNALADGSGDQMECPICSRRTVKRALADYLPNFDVLSQLDREKLVDSDLVCEECTLGQQAEVYCKDCVMNLCGSCARQHRRSKATTRHALSLLMEQDSRSSGKYVHRAQFCTNHKTWRYELYCEDCDTLICYECATEKHQSHSYKLPTGSLIERHRKKIEEVVDGLRGKLSTAQECQRQLMLATESVETMAQKVQEDVLVTFDEVERSLQARIGQLECDLRDIHREFRPKLDIQKGECSTALVDIWRTIDFLEKVIVRGTDVEMLTLKGHLFREKNQLRQLQHWHEKAHAHLVPWKAGSIKAGWSSWQEAEAVLQRIACCGKVEAVASPQPLQPLEGPPARVTPCSSGMSSSHWAAPRAATPSLATAHSAAMVPMPFGIGLMES